MTDLTPEQKDKRIAELEEGLMPFATDAAEIATSIPDSTSFFMEGYEHLGAADFDVGDLRHAASLLAMIGGQTDEDK